ncbi:unnamed protein product, partial [Staurois parvus]
MALVGTGGWHCWAQVGGTAGQKWAELVGGTAVHKWAELVGGTAGHRSSGHLISALIIGANPCSDNCRFSAVLSSRSDSVRKVQPTTGNC